MLLLLLTNEKFGGVARNGFAPLLYPIARTNDGTFSMARPLV